MTLTVRERLVGHRGRVGRDGDVRQRAGRDALHQAARQQALEGIQAHATARIGAGPQQRGVRGLLLLLLRRPDGVRDRRDEGAVREAPVHHQRLHEGLRGWAEPLQGDEEEPGPPDGQSKPVPQAAIHEPLLDALGSLLGVLERLHEVVMDQHGEGKLALLSGEPCAGSRRLARQSSPHCTVTCGRSVCSGRELARLANDVLQS